MNDFPVVTEGRTLGVAPCPVNDPPTGGRPVNDPPASGRTSTGREKYAGQGLWPEKGPLIWDAMHTFLFIIIGLLMLATLGSLFAGMIGMAIGVSGATANRLMRYRVIFQAAAVGLLVVFMSMLKG